MSIDYLESFSAVVIESCIFYVKIELFFFVDNFRFLFEIIWYFFD